jgi:hypothetical protein
MKTSSLLSLCFVFILLAAPGCYTPFSPTWVRNEIERQTGATIQSSFEFRLEGATMKLAKIAASRAAGEPVDFGGLTRVHLAVYELPAGRRMGFGSMQFRGWDKLVEAQQDKFNFMMLVRTKGDALGDLVLMVQGANQILYGRMEGTLPPNLPSTLQTSLGAGGIQSLRERILSSVGGDNAPGGSTMPQSFY